MFYIKTKCERVNLYVLLWGKIRSYEKKNKIKEYSPSFVILSADQFNLWLAWAVILISAYTAPHLIFYIFQYFRNLTTGIQPKISTEFYDLY